MALAILLGGIVGLLIAGGVFAVVTIRQARRDQNDMNEAFADARGEAHDPVFGPAPWSSFDMEALGEEEDAIPVDRSDPYATLTGVASVSWSHSKEANGADDIPPMDDEPTTHFTAEPDQTFVAEPDETFVAEPDETFVAEPDETFVVRALRDVRRRAGPDLRVRAVREVRRRAGPDLRVRAVREVRRRAGGDLRRQAGCDAPRVGRQRRHTGIDRRRAGGLVARPAQSQVIILVVALRALADGLAATITPEGATQLDELEEALAHARGAYATRDWQRPAFVHRRRRARPARVGRVRLSDQSGGRLAEARRDTAEKRVPDFEAPQRTEADHLAGAGALTVRQ